MRKPKNLQLGDTVALIAPSGAVEQNRLSPAVAAVQNMGLKVVLGKNAAASYGYLAGSDEQRASDIMEMFCREDVAGIIALRGGYGAHRLMPLLDFERIAQCPKFFAGYSDITALHTAFSQRCGFITYHTPMPATEFYKGLDNYTAENFRQMAFGNGEGWRLQNPKGTVIKTMRQGMARGQSVGGNLSLVVATLGTGYEIDTQGKILFLEDIGEEPYRIDGMLNQLKNSGKLQDAAGFVLGAFTDCNGKGEKNFNAEQLFNEYLPRNKPTVYNMAFGHVLPSMSFPIGAEATVNADEGWVEFL